MQRDDDDAAWRAIVDNYGDRAELDPEAPVEPPPEPLPEPLPAPPAPEPDPDAFRAPDPPLPPRPTRDRQVAWAGLVGSPLVLLVLLVASVSIPTLVAWVLVGGFVGGFLYLAASLPRHRDDPFDDGARL